LFKYVDLTEQNFFKLAKWKSLFIN
jgi:hypothetical protein